MDVVEVSAHITGEVTGLVAAHPKGISLNKIIALTKWKPLAVQAAIVKAKIYGDLVEIRHEVYASPETSRNRDLEQIILNPGRLNGQYGILLDTGNGRSFIPMHSLARVRRRLARAHRDLDCR